MLVPNTQTQRASRKQSNTPHTSFAMRGRAKIADFVHLHFPDNGVCSGHVSIIGKDWARVHYERVGDALECYVRNTFIMHQQEYYITINSFQGGTHDSEHLFGINNIYFDFDFPELHKNPHKLSNEESFEHEILFKKICAMIDTEYPAGLPKPNTVVYTGRGFGFWWALNQTSYLLLPLYEALVKVIYTRFCNWIMDEGITEIEGDPCASKRAAGLARLPGSYNPKIKRWGYFQILHYNRLDLRTCATELGIGYVTDSGCSTPVQIATGISDFPPAAALARLDMLNGLVRLRTEDDSLRGYRDLILYVACNTLFQVYSEPDFVMSEVLRINDSFGTDAFRISTVRTYMSSSMRKHYAITDYMVKEMLDITDAEMVLLNWSPDWSKTHLGTDNLDLLNDNMYSALLSPEKEVAEWSHASEISTEGMSVRMAQKVKRTIKEKRNTAIKACYAAGFEAEDIAAQFQVSRSTVYRVVNAETPANDAALCAAQNTKADDAWSETSIDLSLCDTTKTIYVGLYLPVYTPIRDQHDTATREDFFNRLKGDSMNTKTENAMDNTNTDNNYNCNDVAKSNSDNIFNISHSAKTTLEQENVFSADEFSADFCAEDFSASDSDGFGLQAWSEYEDNSLSEQVYHRRHPEEGEPQVSSKGLRNFVSTLPSECFDAAFEPLSERRNGFSALVYSNHQDEQNSACGLMGGADEDSGANGTPLDGLIPTPEKPELDSTPSDEPTDWPCYEPGSREIEVPFAPGWALPEAPPEKQPARLENGCFVNLQWNRRNYIFLC